MTVKRYDAHTNIDDFKADWHEKKDGPMVRYDDYAALLKERDEARTALSSAMLTISQITDVTGTSDTLSISGQVAALVSSAAEHQAQGVEKYAVIYEKNAENYPLDSYAWREVMAKRDKVLEFADRLRKGEVK